MLRTKLSKTFKKRHLPLSNENAADRLHPWVKNPPEWLHIVLKPTVTHVFKPAATHILKRCNRSSPSPQEPTRVSKSRVEKTTRVDIAKARITGPDTKMMVFDDELMDFIMPDTDADSDTDDETTTPVKRKGRRPPAHNNKKLKHTPIHRSATKNARRSPRKNTSRRANHARVKQR